MICLACDVQVRGTVYSFGKYSPLCRKCALELEGLSQYPAYRATKEVSRMTQRILTALTYTVVALVAAFQATGVPATTEAWIGLAVLALTTFWGKFSSNTTVVSANRAGEAAADRPPTTL